jgi:hypothetical protein
MYCRFASGFVRELCGDESNPNKYHCHPEQSEGSTQFPATSNAEILRCAQDDSALTYLIPEPEQLPTRVAISL